MPTDKPDTYVFAGVTLPRGPNRAAEYERECEAVKHTTAYRRYLPWPNDTGPLPLFVSRWVGATADDYEQVEHRGPGSEQAAAQWCADTAKARSARDLGRIQMSTVDHLPPLSRG